MTRVALSMRMVQNQSYVEPRDAIAHDWINWVVARDWTPILVPNALPNPGEFLTDVGADLLILTGGNDVVPGETGNGDVEPLRNEAENCMLTHCMQTNTPVFGVCRGMHLINTFFDGAVRPAPPTGAINHVAVTHAVALSGPIADSVRQNTATTNSYHCQVVQEEDVAPDLSSFAHCAEDRLVEGLFHPGLPILAVQWHPERPNPASMIDEKLINRLAADGAFWSA